FESLVTLDQYARLKDFLYITSQEKLAEFDEFVRGLGIKKIQDWWDHKEMSNWIIPCLVKSQSLIPAKDWEATPATTNTGELQHAWTNSLTGIKLTPVEAIESARKLDETVAHEIQASMNTGIIANNQNDTYHRTGRNLQRSSKAAQKVRDSHELTDLSKGTAAEIADLKEIRCQSSAKEKALCEQLKAAKPEKRGSIATAARGNRSVIVSTSSTGRVKTATPMFGKLSQRFIAPSNSQYISQCLIPPSHRLLCHRQHSRCRRSQPPISPHAPHSHLSSFRPVSTVQWISTRG
ncbi:hypothetical protein B0H10DRAFT_1804830, partial [Mycena sp. CBHHK59/15]